jgi:hypothetical protein
MIKNYRKIWEQHYGPIPKGNHIHHIDGNRDNNDISNLMCVTPREHYDIHFSQGDIAAAVLLSEKLNMSDEEKDILLRKQSERITELNNSRVKNRTHQFLSENGWSEKVTKMNIERSEKGIHQWLGDDNPSHQRVKDGTHNFLGENNPSHRRVADGTHHLLGKTNPVHRQVADGTFHMLGGEYNRKRHHRPIVQEIRLLCDTHKIKLGKGWTLRDEELLLLVKEEILDKYNRTPV